MHKKRLITLILLIDTVFATKRLSVTELGRGIDLPIKDRSGIRRVDRFLSNQKLYKEKDAIKECVIKKILGSNPAPDILVDWTNVPNTTHHILRAALAAKGRAITLYEEVYPEKKLENALIQRRFLQRLKALLPANCQPTIITDGGFHNKWFQDVLACNWNYLGRIRIGSGKKYRYTNRSWIDFKALSRKATQTPQAVGSVELCKNVPIATHLYLYKGQVKRKKQTDKFGRKRTRANEPGYRKMAYEPWILATSIAGKSFLSAKRIVKKYQKRMQIEEGLRDLKSSRYGFGFENANSYKIKRIEILLLIAMLASFIAWLVGWVGEQQQLNYAFQSNSVKNRRVLSLFFLGCRMIKKKIWVSIEILEAALKKGLLHVA